MKLEMIYNKEADSTEFILLEEVKFIFKGKEYTIPVGFKSDGCSCGRLLWGWCCALSAQYFKNYLIHDYGYATHFATRAEIDELLYDMNKECGMGMIRNQSIYRTLRICGGSHWNK